MAIDYGALLYDPVYAEIGVPATFATDLLQITITVIDDTRPKALAAGSAEVRSVGPGAFVRIPELEENGIARDDWQDAVLSFNGRDWVVRSYELRGSPNGEDSGEVRFMVKEKPGGAPAAPGNTVLPLISGTTQDTQVLTTTDGTWTGPPVSAYAYQWRRDGVDIGGATAAGYTLSAADVGAMMTVAVTATNAKGSSTAIAVGVGPVIAVVAATAPTNTALPAISGGTTVGSTLTTTTGMWAE